MDERTELEYSALTPAERAQLMLQDAAPVRPEQAWMRGAFCCLQTIDQQLQQILELLREMQEERAQTPRALFEAEQRKRGRVKKHG